MTPVNEPLEVFGLNVWFQENLILKNISHRFPGNRVTAIMGASGSGKTTFLRTLARLNDRIDGFRVQGNVLINGKEVYAKECDVCRLRQTVGMVFQKPCMFPKSIFENVIFGFKHLFPERKKEFPRLAQQALEQAGLWQEVRHRLEQSATKLSQGQQQRLAIARSLMVEPDVLLMDEPTSSLDEENTQVIENLISALSTRYTILLITHDKSQALRVAHHIIKMNAGAIQSHCVVKTEDRQPDNPAAFLETR